MQQLEGLGNKIGTSDDGERLRDQVAEVTSSTNQLSKETNTLMKRLVELSNDQVSMLLFTRAFRDIALGNLLSYLDLLTSASE